MYVVLANTLFGFTYRNHTSSCSSQASPLGVIMFLSPHRPPLLPVYAHTRSRRIRPRAHEHAHSLSPSSVRAQTSTHSLRCTTATNTHTHTHTHTHTQSHTHSHTHASHTHASHTHLGPGRFVPEGCLSHQPHPGLGAGMHFLELVCPRPAKSKIKEWNNEWTKTAREVKTRTCAQG